VTNASSSSAADDTPQKRNVTKRKFPDFSRACSRDNALLSGDESDGWDVELENIQEQIAAFNDAERDAASNMDDPVAEVQEFEYILENIATEEEGNEGNAEDDDADEGGGDVYDSVTVTKKTHTVADLKEICKSLNLNTGGNKAAVFMRIRDCGSALIVPIDAESFVFKNIRGAEADLSLPRWVILNPEPAPDIPGIDMLRGAENGFYGPTNVEGVEGAPKHQYCCSEAEKVRRPEFASKNPDRPTSEKGHISEAARKLLPDEIRYCRPKDFFDTQITPKFVQRCIVDTTNARASAEGAGFGGTIYTDYEPFDLEEVDKMIGLLFLNGLAPRPMFKMWFEHHNIFGNEFVAKAMNKQMARGERAIRGIRRWKHFRRFMCMFDFREDAKKETKSNPLWKVQRLLDELNDSASEMWIPGKWLSIDEQTLGFQGRSALKLRISYKKEGDGFQCDAVCDNGYTFAFYFRHGDAPPLPKVFKEKIPDLSPTAMRVVWLALRLPNEWSRIYMDNLFNSRKLFTALYMAKALAHGVVRTTGRGLPPSVRQLEEKNVKEAMKLRGRTAAARLVNSTDCPDLFAVSVYDTKPVHMLSTVEESMYWVLKKRKVWSAVHREIREIGFLRLNFIDNYNNNMNSTDIADQLRGSYRPDRWMRQRKWWWAFFIWGVGVASVNAFKMYDSMYEEEKEKRGERRSTSGVGMPKKWTHLEFMVELVYDLIFPGRTCAHLRTIGELDDRSISSTRTLSSFKSVDEAQLDEDVDLNCNTGREEYLAMKAPTVMTKKAMKTNDKWPRRFDGMRHASLPVTDRHCQYCHYQYKYEYDDAQKGEFGKMKKNREHVRRCLVCNVNLCYICENEFHGVQMCETAKLLGK
jgi:hypothetical protein